MLRMKAAFTIVTPNYLAHAKVLGNTLLFHNPRYVFFIGLIGKKDEILDEQSFKNFHFIELESLAIEQAAHMQAQYSLFELSCALKPYFAHHILTNYQNCERLKYFDSDIMVFNRFNETMENDTASAIFLTPHYFRPIHPSEGMFNDTVLIKYGIYNAGFFEVSNCTEAISFLIWWKNYLLDYCFNFREPCPQIFVDQNLLDLVPIFFKNVSVVRDLGYNVSFYNLHERELSISADKRFCLNNGLPIVFFHYTTYKYYNHEGCSAGYTRFNFVNTPILRTVCEMYRDALLENNVDGYFSRPLQGPKQAKKKSIKTILKDKFKSILD